VRRSSDALFGTGADLKPKPRRADHIARAGTSGVSSGMDRQGIIAKLREHQAELERLGVRHVALFGSVACGDAGADSDIDIAIDLDKDALPDLFAYAGMKRYIAGLFPGPVDVVDRAALKPGIRALATRDLVSAF
jgi:predicted nucleotidyltransferase